MIIKILAFTLFLVAGFQGLKHFGVIGGDTPKDTEIEEKRKTSKAGLNTRNARGQVKNINSTLPQDVQVARKTNWLSAYLM